MHWFNLIIFVLLNSLGTRSNLTRNYVQTKRFHADMIRVKDANYQLFSNEVKNWLNIYLIYLTMIYM